MPCDGTSARAYQNSDTFGRPPDINCEMIRAYVAQVGEPSFGPRRRRFAFGCASSTRSRCADASQETRRKDAPSEVERIRNHPRIIYNVAPDQPDCTWPYKRMFPPCMSTWPEGDPNYHGTFRGNHESGMRGIADVSPRELMSTRPSRLAVALPGTICAEPRETWAQASASATALPQMVVSAGPPRSRVRSFSTANTFSTALMMAAAASTSPR
jgi:hypothetical protein